MAKKKSDEGSFVFYRSFYDVINLIPDEAVRSKAYAALCEYGFFGIEPAEDADVLVKMVFTQAKPQIDANNKRRENGRIGGKAPKKTEEQKESKEEATDKQRVSKIKQTPGKGEPNVNVNANENVNANVTVNQNENENGTDNGYTGAEVEVLAAPDISADNREYGGQIDRPAVFIPPTLEQIRDYAAKKQLDIDAEYFMEYYTANGWMTGNEAVRDWRAVLRSWARQEKRWQECEVHTTNRKREQKGENNHNGEMERKFGILV